MRHIKLFEGFEIDKPLPDGWGKPLSKREILYLKEYDFICPEFILKDDGYYYIDKYN
jgi:hypothetical protein